MSKRNIPFSNKRKINILYYHYYYWAWTGASVIFLTINLKLIYWYVCPRLSQPAIHSTIACNMVFDVKNIS